MTKLEHEIKQAESMINPFTKCKNYFQWVTNTFIEIIFEHRQLLYV